MSCKIKDLCERIGSGGTPSRKNKSYYNLGNIKWLKTKELDDIKIYDTEEKITEEGLKKSSAKLYPKDTIVMAMYGATVGKLGIIKEEMCTNQACCNMVVDSNKCNYKFLYYSLLYNRESIINLANGAAQQNLSVGVIGDYEINLPSLEEQEKIANILSSLDDKIELNNEMNKTLEEMAQSIFKRWFVDFEFPNEDGEPYKSSGGEMVDSELGMIPKGWKYGTLDDIANITMGVSPKSSSYNTENIGMPLLNGASDFNGTIINPTKYTTEPKKICKKDDMVFCIRATIGNLTFTDREYCIGRGVASVTPIDTIYREFIYFNINTSIKSLISKASGSVFLNLTKDNINKMDVVIPTSEILNKFSLIVKNLVDKISENNLQNQNIAKLRDELLPKLMSGEINLSK